ncbi:hypothetical protein ACIRLA_40825 [Streptomyces sp. NPDC102364]|uniref:hypothetical protein n=1 Tax=Streptomyces sp. NPDC102364 TaxID=3366161 RepID=UPI0037FC1E08
MIPGSLLPQPDPQHWAVLTVISRGQEYDLYEGPVEGYQLHMLCGELLSDGFPDDSPMKIPATYLIPRRECGFS